MTAFRAALVALLVVGAAQADAAERIGTAVRRGGLLCMQMPGEPVAAGAPVVLVDPAGGQRTARARVVSAGPPCAAEEGARAYRLRAPGRGVEENSVLAAVLGTPRVARPRQGPLVIGAGTDALTFRICSSTDGVHLTAWRGTPLHSPRAWHEYVYLGMDLEPNCNPAETDSGAGHG